MEFKGTKGEWELTTDGEANFYGIAANKDWLIRIQQNGSLGVKEQEANAKLIACSLELLIELDKARSTISRLKNSMKAHPDCVEDSEFADYVDLAEFAEDSIEKLLKKATE